MAGFDAQHFSVSTALCDGGAYLLSVAALPPPLPKEGGYSFTTCVQTVNRVDACEPPEFRVGFVPQMLARVYAHALSHKDSFQNSYPGIEKRMSVCQDI